MATWSTCWERAREPVDVAAAAAAACAAGASLEALLAPHAATVRLAHSPTAGRHLVAARRIPALSCVMLDPAVCWYPSPCDSMGATIPGMCEVRPGLARGTVDGVLAQLAPFAAAARAALPPPPAALPRHDLFIAACALNALGALVDEDAPADRRRVPMVCAAAAMINHSCAPNCSYEGYYDAAAAAPGVRIYAEEDIAEGEEVTISYVPRHAPAAERRERLSVLYGFACACARCGSGVEDTIVFAPAHGGACIPSGGSASAGALALLRQRDAWLAGAAGRADVLTGTPPAPPPLLAPGDQGLYGALYALLGGLWALDPAAHPGLRALQCAVGASVCDAGGGALGARGRGRCFVSDALLITGHYHALAGQRDAASAYYARARALFGALYGEGDFRCALAGELCASPPSTRAQAERAEAVKLARTRNWGVLHGVSGEALARWVRGTPARSAGAGGAAGDAAAMRALLGASKAIMMQGGLLARASRSS